MRLLFALLLTLTANTFVFPQDSPREFDARSEAVRELTELEGELTEELNRLDAERERLSKVIQNISKLRQLQITWEKLDERLRRDDLEPSEADALSQQHQQIERQIDALWRIRATRERQQDISWHLEFLSELSGKGNRKIRDRLSLHNERLTRLLALLAKLENAEWKAKELERVTNQISKLEDSIDRESELVEAVGQWIRAIEEDEIEEAESMKRRIDKLSNENGDEKESKTTDEDLGQSPVQINEQSLARYREADLKKDVVPLLKRHCYDCHSNDGASGDLNFETLIAETPLVINRSKWINVIEQTKNHVMPPEDAETPDRHDREKLVLSLHHLVNNFDYDQIRNPGFEMTRRLTHDEYDRTVGDLFGVEVQIAKRFPDELAGESGFHNSANTLFLQPTLMERYITAADEIVETLLPATPKTQRQRTALAAVFIQQPSRSEPESKVARDILFRFVGRAFRRQLDDQEREKIMSRYQRLRSRGIDHSDSIRSIIRQSLISPQFLLKFESSPPDSADHQVDAWELATRLSYFLWASMPDDQLFTLAATGELLQPNVLREQVDRMLSHPRSDALGELFAAQWLGSQHLGTRIRLDPIENPWCTESLMKAMRDETSMLFRSLVNENESIGRLLNADFTFVNEELANHYRLRGVKGDEMRRVSLRHDPRGGILGHGSILATTSFPNRTSPVVRGKWVLDTLLGTPPPPPPPNVSELPDEVLENERLTTRQKLARHRESAQCNACHREMDPIGLALERYDWFGRYRTRMHRQSINDSGVLPDGTRFAGLAGLNEVLSETRSKDLVRQVSSKMLSYALGRQLEYYDEPALRDIIKKIGMEENRFQSLVHEIVQSYPFRYKRVQP